MTTGLAEKRKTVNVGGFWWNLKMHAAEEKARLDIRRLENGGLIVHRVYMAGDGWGDGWLTVHAIVETPYLNRLFKIKWNEFNRGWMKKLDAGGWGIFNG